VAHFHVKTKKGRPYLYVREIARVGGRPKVVSQTYIGSPDRVRQLASVQPAGDVKLRVEEFGALWLANEMDRGIDLAAIVDAVIARGQRETGPTVGEYFLYCVLNRMVESRSKNRMAEWYQRTAIQQIRPVEIKELTSERYWEKWDRVSEKSLKTIARQFFQRVWKLESVSANCLLFDTTNTYTFMASDTESELSMRGKNKASRHHLRQIGLGLLVERDSRLPLYYRVYPGNLHDSKLFHAVMDEMFGVACGLNDTKQKLTVVIDKGMNAEDNYSWIDEHARMHFVTTYSPYFAEGLARTPRERFEPVDIEKNRRLAAEDQEGERLLAYRTVGEFWGKERAVVVTHNPRTERKKNYTLDAKLETIRQHLLEMRQKVNNNERQWRNRDAIMERYHRLCGRLHVPSELYEIKFSGPKDGLQMSFEKNIYEVKKTRASFGRNIIITDNTDWTTSDIVQTSLDRWEVEDAFRLSNDDELVSLRPVRHWTDSKIRCHLFSCVVALTYLRRLENRLGHRGVRRTAASVMDDMRHLHSVLSLSNGRRQPQRTIEAPSKTQREVLHALEHRVDSKGVLRPESAQGI
jgi:transposase